MTDGLGLGGGTALVVLFLHQIRYLNAKRGTLKGSPFFMMLRIIVTKPATAPSDPCLR